METRTKIRAIAIDLDGTVLRNDSTLSDRTADALRACLKNGIELIICTGRSPTSAEKHRLVLGASGPMVFYNGATVIDVPDGKLLASTLLPRDCSETSVAIARDLGLHFHAFLPGDRLVYEENRPESESYHKRTGLNGELADFDVLLKMGGPAEAGFIKCMYIAEPDQLDLVQKEIDQRLGTRVYSARSHRTFLEVMAPGVSKGRALALALDLRGISRMETVAFGDAENDVPMLEYAGRSYAVANAVTHARNVAYATIGSNEEDGVAVILEKILQNGGFSID